MAGSAARSVDSRGWGPRTRERVDRARCHAGFIIGASLNSYLNSLGPPGDHSVENASAESRALWEAAGAGQLDEVIRITTETCADPWVKFPVGTGRHDAKGYAEAHELRGNDDVSPFYPEISDLLGDYQNDWYDRCAQIAG